VLWGWPRGLIAAGLAGTSAAEAAFRLYRGRGAARAASFLVETAVVVAGVRIVPIPPFAASLAVLYLLLAALVFFPARRALFLMATAGLAATLVDTSLLVPLGSLPPRRALVVGAGTVLVYAAVFGAFVAWAVRTLARSFEERRRRGEEDRALARISRALLGPGAVAGPRAALEEVRAVTGATFVRLGEVRDHGGPCDVPREVTGAGMGRRPRAWGELPEAAATLVQGEPWRSPGPVSASDGWLICVPVMVEGHWVATLTVGDPKGADRRQGDRFLGAAADALGAWWARTEAQAALQRTAASLDAPRPYEAVSSTHLPPPTQRTP